MELDFAAFNLRILVTKDTVSNIINNNVILKKYVVLIGGGEVSFSFKVILYIKFRHGIVGVYY